MPKIIRIERGLVKVLQNKTVQFFASHMVVLWHEEWWVGDVPFYLKFWVKLTPPRFKNGDFQTGQVGLTSGCQWIQCTWHVSSSSATLGFTPWSTDFSTDLRGNSTRLAAPSSSPSQWQLYQQQSVNYRVLHHWRLVLTLSSRLRCCAIDYN